MLKRLSALCLAALSCAVLLTGCGGRGAADPHSGDPAMSGWKKHTVTWFDVFDTVTTVLGYAPSEEEWQRQMDALHEDLVSYHQLYDIYHSYSGITNLRDVNQTAGTAPVTVDPRIFAMLTEAVELFETTQGQLNIAMGQVYRLWHHAREAAEASPESAVLPQQDQLTAAAEHGSIEALVLDPETSTVYFSDPELRLDVGSVGKGYAVEMAARAAEERGLQSALISVGGNLRAIGRKPDGSRWSGGIQNPWTDQPGAPEDPYLGAVELEDLALVTSGNYQRYFLLDGVRYHHLIDPDTLFPANYYSSVAVLGPDSGTADCLSTGLFCMEFEEGKALVESLDGVEAMWMFPDGSIQYSSSFQDHLKAPKAS